jgi:hypothetical protein
MATLRTRHRRVRATSSGVVGDQFQLEQSGAFGRCSHESILPELETLFRTSEAMGESYCTETGLPLEPPVTFAQLAEALGMAPWALARRIHQAGFFAPPTPDASLTRTSVHHALSVVGLAPVPRREDLVDGPRITLGFVAWLGGCGMAGLVATLREVGLLGDEGSWATDPAREIDRWEMAILTTPDMPFEAACLSWAEHLESVYERLAGDMAKIRSAPPPLPVPLAEVPPTIDEIDGYSSAPPPEAGQMSSGVLSPRELILDVAAGHQGSYTLARLAGQPEWAEAVEYACECYDVKTRGELRPVSGWRHPNVSYREEDHWKWVVRALRDRPDDPGTLAGVVWGDAYLAEFLVAIEHAPGLRALAGELASFPQWLRNAVLDRAVPLILEDPRDEDCHRVEHLLPYCDAGFDLRFIERSLETGVDGPALGVSYAWAGTEDSVFWALREFPREKVRMALTCIMPPDGFSPSSGATILDPRLQGLARREFGLSIAPILLLDRSREVRRRARLAELLSGLPPVVVPFRGADMRALAADRPRYLLMPDDFKVSKWPSSEAARQLIARMEDLDYIPMDLLEQVLDFVTDATAGPADRDRVQGWALSGTATPARWHHVMGRATEAGDLELALAVLEATNQPVAIQLLALRAFPDEPAVLGAALASRTVRSDPRVLEILLASTNPHVLYALARARVSVAVTRRAFRALGKLCTGAPAERL